MAFESIEFETEFATPADWAMLYRRLGWQIVPALMPAEDVNWKRPALVWREFEKTWVPDAEFFRWFGPDGQHRNRMNMGVIAGAVSGRLVVIDLDTRDGKDGGAWWRDQLITHLNGLEPETPTQRTGGGGRQLVFRAREGWTPPTIRTPIGVDIRGQGGFAMLPPSQHSSGQRYAWEAGREPWSIPIADLPPELEAAIDRLWADYGRGHASGVQTASPDQERDAFGLIVDGREARMAGIVWGIACDLRRALPQLSDPEGHPLVESERERAWGLYLYDVKTRLAGLSNEEGLEREGRGRTAFIERWVRALLQWNGKLQQEAALPKPSPPPKLAEPMGHYDPWARFNVPAFPMTALPDGHRALVEHLTVAIGADPAGIAMATLTVLSGALDQRFRLKMRQSGSWYAPPRLWTMLVGESATRKSAVIGEAVAPLRRIESEFQAQQARDMARWEALDKGDRGTKPPPATRFVTNDTTVEAASRVLARQDRGVLAMHDELSGFIGSLDRYTNNQGASDRAFWLTAYNGGPYTVDRAERTTHIANLCVAILGGIQPERIRELRDLMTDGLLQRFLPVIIGRGPLSQEVDSDLLSQRYSDTVSYLANMKPQTFQLSGGAREACEAFRAGIWKLEAETEAYGSSFCAWIGKLPGIHGSLSLLLHVLENKAEAPYLEVSDRTATNAALILTDFMIPHARAFYDDVLGRFTTDDETIGRYLLGSENSRFTRSDLQSNCTALKGRKSAWEFNEILAPFITGGWLIEDGDKAWIIAPWVRDFFADRRARELRQKARKHKLSLVGEDDDQP